MAGSMLGPDQIRKINAAFPALVSHIRELLAADKTGVGLMKVHCMVESFDSDEMARIFRELSFISPLEKKALVRAAIYEVMALDPLAFVSPEILAKSTVAETVLVKPETMKVFSPPQFKLNVATSGAEEIAKTDTKPTPPAATSTHTAKVAERIEAGNKEQKAQAEKLAEETKEVLAHDAAQQAKLDAAVAKLRASSTPQVVEEVLPLPNVPDVPEALVETPAPQE